MSTSHEWINVSSTNLPHLFTVLCIIESWLVLQTYCKHRHFTMHLLHLPIWFIFPLLTFCQHSSGINNNKTSRLDTCLGYDILVNNRTCDTILGSCSSNIASGYTQRNCYCDDWCFVYGDCCQDKVKTQGKTKTFNFFSKHRKTCFKQRRSIDFLLFN